MGWLTATDGAAILAAGAIQRDAVTVQAIGLPPPQQTITAMPQESWGNRKVRIDNAIREYVKVFFPLGIVCRARYYGSGTKVVGQVVVDNTFA